MDLEQITRDIFRIPILEPDDVTALIESQIFTVINLGNKGIGIQLQKQDTFPVCDEIVPISLNLNSNKFELRGRIVHVSPHDSGYYLCGIELIDMTQDCIYTVNEYIKNHRSNMFIE